MQNQDIEIKLNRVLPHTPLTHSLALADSSYHYFCLTVFEGNMIYFSCYLE